HHFAGVSSAQIGNSRQHSANLSTTRRGQDVGSVRVPSGPGRAIQPVLQRVVDLKLAGRRIDRRDGSIGHGLVPAGRPATHFAPPSSGSGRSTALTTFWSSRIANSLRSVASASKGARDGSRWLASTACACVTASSTTIIDGASLTTLSSLSSSRCLAGTSLISKVAGVRLPFLLLAKHVFHWRRISATMRYELSAPPLEHGMAAKHQCSQPAALCVTNEISQIRYDSYRCTQCTGLV